MNTHSPAEDAADWIATTLADVPAVAALLDAAEATEGYAEATVRPR
jgi:hypothetical protein